MTTNSALPQHFPINADLDSILKSPAQIVTNSESQMPVNTPQNVYAHFEIKPA